MRVISASRETSVATMPLGNGMVGATREATLPRICFQAGTLTATSMSGAEIIAPRKGSSSSCHGLNSSW